MNQVNLGSDPHLHLLLSVIRSEEETKELGALSLRPCWRGALAVLGRGGRGAGPARGPVLSRSEPSGLLEPGPARHHPWNEPGSLGPLRGPRVSGGVGRVWAAHSGPFPRPLALSSCRLCCLPGPALLFPALTSRVVGVGGWSRRRLEGEMLLVNKPSTPLALIGFVEADTLST